MNTTTKTYPVIVKYDKGSDVLSVKSPSGKAITVSDSQIANGSMIHVLLFNRYSKMDGVVEMPVKDMETLLEASKLKERPKTGETVVQFKKNGKYREFTMKFNDNRHEDNYINKMINNGYSYIGSHKI